VNSRDALRALIDQLPAECAVTIPATWIRELLDAQPAPGTAPLPGTDDDHLLAADEVAARFGLSRDWLYRHWKGIPGAVKLGRKVLRFPVSGIRQYLNAHRSAKVS
jgi:predicted DNA-binding transcriptional regulator AlpA